MAADRAIDQGIKLSELEPETITALNRVLPPVWSHRNPVNIIGDATPGRYRAALDICLEDPGVDGAIVILTPQAMTRPSRVAEELIRVAQSAKKPILTSWMGGERVKEARQLLKSAHIPVFSMLESAVDAFSFLGTYNRNQRFLLQTPAKLVSGYKPPDIGGARVILENVLADRRKLLTQSESLAVLKAFKIPVAQNVVCGTGDLEISNLAAQSLYRQENIRVLQAGIMRDPVFGPVITFGSGGANVEMIGDSAVSIPPLNRRLARDLLDRTRVGKMLAGFRDTPAIKMGPLIDILIRVSNMACELPWIQAMDINPLLVDENGAVAVKANICVGHSTTSADPYNHLAIYPYPAHLVTQARLKDGTDIVIRPIRPEDAEIEQQFIRGLSKETKYFRFMNTINELSQEMLVRFTQIDYHSEMALVAIKHHGDSEEELGVARYITNIDQTSCEFAVVVSDRWQGMGIAHLLMSKLIEIARRRGLEIMEGQVLSNNSRMLDLMRSLDFQIRTDPDEAGIKLVECRLN
jgi:acetyltransferase